LCNFRLYIKSSADDDDIGQLLVFEHGKSDPDIVTIGVTGIKFETVFETIRLTQELKAMDGRMIQCARIDNQWVFKQLRDDRPHPNGRGTVVGT